jgi:two-component system NtrC family response regulator
MTQHSQISPELPVLLIVEDDEGLQRQLKWAYEGYRVVSAGDRARAIELVRLHEPAVVTLDLGLPPDPDGTAEGFATLTEILELKPDTKIIVASGHGARESALKAIALGAYDFYRKPVDIDELGLIVGRAFHVHEIEAENRRLEAMGAGTATAGALLTASPEMLKVTRTIERVANADVSVMLLGASGTGKELLARAVHGKSSRSKGEFVAINCAAIPENLLEAELFGYERGAFTGAVKTTPGKIELAQGGTLFLDEVGDIPLPLQVKLLRFLQERVIERIGGRAPIAVDTRIVCATHQDLEAMIADGRFRDDLYYRLAEIVVRIPSLAERAGDAVLLARHFVNRFAAEMNPRVQGLAPDAAEAIDAYSWPGNVRELENRIKRAIIMTDGKLVGASDLDLPGAQQGGGEPLPINLRAAREVADRRAIHQALTRTEHNISGAAKLLGISRPTLYDLMKQYHLQT